jgi:PleD family two-component response regulator
MYGIIVECHIENEASCASARTPSEKSYSEIVCLVDDDPAVLKSLGQLLASYGFSVRSCSTATAVAPPREKYLY